MSIETTILDLAELKKRNSKIGAKFLNDSAPLHLTDISKYLKPFVDIEAQIEKAMKTLENQRSIPKTSQIK